MPTARPAPARLILPRDQNEAELTVGRKKLRLTNLQKPFWPGITKRDLLQYYADIAPFLMPHVKNRAMVMKRYPSGASGSFFFMKRALDGIIAENVEARYEAGERTGSMPKIKDLRTAECVVGGFRYGSKQRLVGSLLLGLCGDDGLLHHVGFPSSIAAEERPALTERLEALRKPPAFTGRAPGGPSRWSSERSGEFEPLAPEAGGGSAIRPFTGGRFRHGTRFLRWRPDKAPRQCTMAQVEHESRSPLHLIERARTAR